MPEKMERALKKTAKKKFGGTTSERAKKYIWGTLRKTGWTPSTQKESSDNALKRAVMQARAKKKKKKKK